MYRDIALIIWQTHIHFRLFWGHNNPIGMTITQCCTAGLFNSHLNLDALTKLVSQFAFSFKLLQCTKDADLNCKVFIDYGCICCSNSKNLLLESSMQKWELWEEKKNAKLL